MNYYYKSLILSLIPMNKIKKEKTLTTIRE